MLSAGVQGGAVALYGSRPEATIKQIAAELGINPETLRNWIRSAGSKPSPGPPGGGSAVARAVVSGPGGRGRGLAAGERRVEEGARDPAQGGPAFRFGHRLVNCCQVVENHQRRLQ
ncbi:transposase [Streptomyces phaeochromogenes]|uniref:transposase n=1 Tax=Streptomyces phaeochromogenes TaxID=1923 RepID=UPI0033C6E0DD